MVKHKGSQHVEREHAHREEADFRTLARRNKLLGLWAADKLGFHGDAAEAYAREVILSDLEEPGEDDLFRKVIADFARHKIAVTQEELAAKLSECFQQAKAELAD